MSKQKEVPTISMTEEQLELVIKSAVKNALYEMKTESKERPGLQEDELAVAATTFGLLKVILVMLFGGLGATSLMVTIAALVQLIQNGFQWIMALIGFDFGGFTIVSFCAIREILKTKKLEVLNTIFSAIMAVAGLIVAVVGAVFAYKAL